MSTVNHARPASPGLFEHTDCHAAHFATRWLQPDIAVITAHGELDAANAQAFVDYALRHADRMSGLVIDLSGIEFFGTAGFSALHNLNVRCAAEQVWWALSPSCAVTRLLRICDPDSTLPIHDDVDTALAAVQGGGQPAPLLHLVPEAR